MSEHGTEAHAAYGRRYWEMIDIIELMPEAMDHHGIFMAAFWMYMSLIRLAGS